MTERCEPPPELSGKDGWHWLKKPEGPLVPRRWDSADKAWGPYTSDFPGLLYRRGWRYGAPVLTPDEVAGAVAAEREACAKIAGTMQQVAAEIGGDAEERAQALIARRVAYEIAAAIRARKP